MEISLFYTEIVVHMTWDTLWKPRMSPPTCDKHSVMLINITKFELFLELTKKSLLMKTKAKHGYLKKQKWCVQNNVSGQVLWYLWEVRGKEPICDHMALRNWADMGSKLITAKAGYRNWKSVLSHSFSSRNTVVTWFITMDICSQ